MSTLHIQAHELKPGDIILGDDDSETPAETVAIDGATVTINPGTPGAISGYAWQHARIRRPDEH